MKKDILIKLLILILLFNSQLLFSKYLDSKSCNECHPTIYKEHASSMHHKSSIYTDEIHTKMKEAISPRKYACAICHTPAVKNLRPLMQGKSQPSEFDHRLKDGVSCSYCHQISKVIFTKQKGVNFSTMNDKLKPTFFGNLESPESSSKHNSSSNNSNYVNSKVCMGCHSHKINKNDIQICSTLDEVGQTSDCISCHMPKKKGTPTKLNAKARVEYTSHEFLGIHSEQMVKQAIELKLKQLSNNSFELYIKNKMGHSIITQPMRLKYAKTEILRDKKIIWQNFDKNPYKDKDTTFSIIFKDINNKPTFPAFAKGYIYNNNLKSKEEKRVIYKLKELKKGDIIKSTWVSYIIAPKIAKKLDITDKELTKQILGQTVQLKIK
ncbi:hypothetical protein LPB137_02500 [Poseidonibacter parvus]|uniref:Cytochrome c-552/4 domain-containing protein n=1 Tax=Poseidonibacter parvus TaxID=1850254 RepID=A0A1P8KJT7_9BACT|nr:multiheme c-type cytochrome [Poseidonibacter parvus]APW64795.1 hypothetical protein LPB137_02500 [Poseidonibacter parvus]